MTRYSTKTYQKKLDVSFIDKTVIRAINTSGKDQIKSQNKAVIKVQKLLRFPIVARFL